MRAFPGYTHEKINWKIENFKETLMTSPTFYDIQSPEFKFYLSNFHQFKFALSAIRNGKTLSLYLRRKYESQSSFSKSLKVNFEMKVLGSWGEYFNVQKGSYTDPYCGEHRLGKIVCLKDLQGPSRRCIRIVDEKRLNITVKLDIIEVTEPRPDSAIDDLSKSFEKMFNNDKYSDFTLVTDEKQEIPCHRNVLAIRSPVFEAMLESKMKENSDGKAVIDDIHGESLVEFMRFLYCGRVNKIEEFATDLLYAANKYDLKDLKPHCICSLAQNISPTNIFDTILLADLHQEEQLKKFCLHYLSWNYDEIKNSEEWKSLPNGVMKEVLDFIATSPTLKKKPIEILSTVKYQTTAANRVPIVVPPAQQG